MNHHLRLFLNLTLNEKRRNVYKNVVCSLGIVLIVLLFLGASQSKQKPPVIRNYEYDLVSQDDLADYLPGEQINKIYYTPVTNLTEQLMEDVRNRLYIVDERIVPVATDSEMELILLGGSYVSYGVNIRNASDNGQLNYIIRTKNNNFRTDETYSRDVLTAYRKRDNEYVESGFLALQNALDQSYLDSVKRKTQKEPEQKHRIEYGHIPVDENQGPQKPTRILEVTLILAILFVLSSIYILLLPMVQDRAVGMREFLKLATPTSEWLEMALFLVNFLLLMMVLIVCLFIAILGYGVWDLAQWIYVMILGTLFVANLNTFQMFLSTTLESSAIAAAVVPVVVFVPLMLSNFSSYLMWMFLIFPANGLYYGGSIFYSFKSSGHKFEFVNIFTVRYPGLNYINLLSVYLLQLVGTSAWLFLWFYVSNVFPGRYGTPKSKLFCVSRRYMRLFSCLKRKSKIKNLVDAESQHELQHYPNGSNDQGRHHETIVMEYMDECPEPFEQFNATEKPVVKIKNLSKTFPGKNGTKVAVKNFSLSIYSNSITVLLGHNGAGKTTTMNIITGMLAPSDGTVVVDGVGDVSQYRHQIGFCPQHDVFFSYLSCVEHLVFFGRLRGLQDAVAKDQAMEVLQKVNLLDKRDALFNTLSGGMKRRLSLAIAIVGHTKVLILDEPTSGLDPESRRDIWDILLKLRQNHTILLTTHFMEEAEVLGDWIAIMEEGELIASGTTIFLKQRFGTGYKLKMLKRDNFNQEATKHLIHQYIPNATERESVKETFVLTLPYDDMSNYEPMLKELEEKCNELGIESIDITNATLEEVFLNSSTRRKEILHHAESVDSANNTQSRQMGGNVAQKSGFTFQAVKNTIFAIWRKKWIHVRSNMHIYGMLAALPLFVTALCFTFVSGSIDAVKALPAVALDGRLINQAYGVLVVNRVPGSERNKAFQDITAIQSDFERYPVNGVWMKLLEDVKLEDALQDLIAQDYTAYRDRLVVGIACNVTSDDVQMTVLYNNNLLHSTGIGESITTTLLLRYSAGVEGASVHAQNIPSTRTQLVDILKPYYFTELIALAFYFYMLMFLQVPLQERLSGFRQLLNINQSVYWGSTYAFDLLVHLIECLAVLGAVCLFDRTDSLDYGSRVHMFWTLFLYGVIALPVLYLISQCVDNINTAITIMGYMMVFGVIGVLLLSNGHDDIKNNKIPIFLFHLVPEFALKHSLRVVYENQKSISYERSLIEQNKGSLQGHTFAKEHIAPDILYVISLFHFVSITACLFLVDNMNRREKLKDARESVADTMRKIRPKQSKMNSGEESADGKGIDQTDSPVLNLNDVEEESKLVKDLVDGGNNTAHSSEKSKKYAIVVHGLKKTYSKHEAVKSVSFAVEKGECFGLLGMNGAGKTSVFQMLTRNMPLTGGKVYLQNCEVQQTNEHEYRNQYGYCPQTDVLLDFMTVYEVIDYFAQIQGLETREKTIASWLAQLDIQEYRDHVLRDCSGGTKRKVNTILALLGGPSVVLLDEPTTGVDPKSRHFLWKTIKSMQQKDQTILLTSHSMDECEELCNRLSIMVSGRLRCIGTIPHLKKTYGQGYNLWIKLNIPIEDRAEIGEDDTSKDFIEEVKERFVAELQEQHKGLFRFVVSIKLSMLFAKTVSLKEKYGEKILYFSINESSLEDIFLKFRPTVKQQS